MHDQPKLSDAEWAVVLDLLEQESHELPVEIRHTRSQEFAKNLHERLDIVTSLIQRIRSAAPTEPTVV